MSQTLIAQFAKWPELGNVKTRLAKTLGEPKALQVHMWLLEAVVDNLNANGVGDYELWLNKVVRSRHLDSEGGLLEREASDHLEALISAHHIKCHLQKGSNLGHKMAHAIISKLKDYDKVIIVGSDCPNVSKDVIMLASNALDQSDLVICPAEDGGYVLIGARRFEPELFSNVEWGSGAVLEQTLSNA